jgi:hypothetical protein
MGDSEQPKREAWWKPHWRDMRGNAKWSLVVTGLNFVLAVLGRVTHGPTWEMWAFITIAVVCFGGWTCFPKISTRTWFRTVIIGAVVIVILSGIMSFKTTLLPSPARTGARQAALMSLGSDTSQAASNFPCWWIKSQRLKTGLGLAGQRRLR